MQSLLENLAIEIGLLSLLGLAYYLYQKKKILHFEENKNTIVMNWILESCLAEKTDEQQPLLDQLISDLDDYIQHRNAHPPIGNINKFLQSSECSPELKEVILSSLNELAV